jgi:hypothetical protein
MNGAVMIRIQQTIVVGLGRQGRAALEHLKRLIVKYYDDLPAIMLLAIDMEQPPKSSTEDDEEYQPVLNPMELLELTLADIGDSPAHLQRAYPWLPQRIVAAEQGWENTRAAHRLALHLELGKIYDFLQFHLNRLGNVEVRDQMADLGFEIASDQNEASLVVLGGLGDVAGSAFLLDMTYLVHYLFRRVGLQIASTGVLFMPPLIRVDSNAEACAYAALKEINACMEELSYSCSYEDFRVDAEIPPFNRGLYLIDIRNEQGLTLRDQTEVERLGAEWLFRVLLSPLKSSIDDFTDLQGVQDKVEDQLAVYSSFGLSAFVLPADALVEWSANRLGHEIISDHLLRSEMFARVSNRLTIFYNKTHLHLDDLMEEYLRMGVDGTPIKLKPEYIIGLKNVPHERVPEAVQSTLNRITKEMVPNLQHQIEANARRLIHDVEDIVKQEVSSILISWPSGGLSLACQFLRRLNSDCDEFSQSLLRREAAFRGQNQQLTSHLNQLSPALKRAVASKPTISLAAFATLAGLCAPFLLTSIWTWQSFRASIPFMGIILILILFSAIVFCLVLCLLTHRRTDRVDSRPIHQQAWWTIRFRVEPGPGTGSSYTLS